MEIEEIKTNIVDFSMLGRDFKKVAKNKIERIV